MATRTKAYYTIYVHLAYVKHSRLSHVTECNPRSVHTMNFEAQVGEPIVYQYYKYCNLAIIDLTVEN